MDTDKIIEEFDNILGDTTYVGLKKEKELKYLLRDALQRTREDEKAIIKLCAKEQSCSMCKEYLGRSNK